MIRSVPEIHRDNAKRGRPSFSIEFFPPKTEEGESVLFSKTLPTLAAANPDYCSVTYGAGGSTRDKTLGMVKRIQDDFDLTTVMHLTCVNATRDELSEVIQEARKRGVKNILALRGDPPGGTGDWVKTEGGFQYSSELVAFLKTFPDMSIATAGFPEGHIAQIAGREADWEHLAHKIRQGAQFVVTQLFLTIATTSVSGIIWSTKWGLRCRSLGLLPVISRNQTKRFTAMCGARLPTPS